MCPTDKSREAAMNLLELVSAITRQGWAVTGTEAAIKHRKTIFQFIYLFLIIKERGWEVRAKRRVK